MATGRFSHMPDPHIEQIRQVQYNRQHTEYQYFPEEYFSGSDITIYFGDTWLDDLTGLQFGLHEPVRPIHGYASYTWDAVARGSRTVQGQFRIAFKEAGYLHTVLDHLGNMGANAKPRLAYLMGGETPPNWLAGVKDNIEDLLKRWHGNPNSKAADKYVNETYLDHFEWPVLKHVRLDKNMVDAKKPNLKKRKRQGVVNGKHSSKGTKYLGSVSQLQSRLMELGYGWGPWKWTEGKNRGRVVGSPDFPNRASGQKTPPKSITMYKPQGNWKLVCRFGVNNAVLQHPPYYSIYEAEMQRRLGQYPGKNSQLKNAMGGPNGAIDGQYGRGWTDPAKAKKYGVGTAKAVDIFQDLCYAPAGGKTRSSGGYYLTDYVYQELKKGFTVNGVFDTPTMIAVKLFQESKGLLQDGIVGPKTRAALAPKATRKKKIAGASNYSPDKLFEPRAAKYEKEVWGRASSVDKNHNRRTFFYHKEGGSEYLKKHGFDIYLTYGPYPEQVIKGKGQMATKIDSKTAGFNTTVKAIRNVQLTGVQQVLDASGQPVEEIYSFIAKDLD